MISFKMNAACSQHNWSPEGMSDRGLGWSWKLPEAF